ncbi:MAG: flagella basal body P-ring formation protein FlgA [Polyangiaceae bacterium]
MPMRGAFKTLSLVLALLAISGTASAEATRTLEGARIRLGQLVTTSDAQLADVDLGPAPPPGSSRLVSREDVVRELRTQGLSDKGLNFPAVLRVISASRRYNPSELAALLLPEINAALPSGVDVKDLKVTRGVVTSPHATVARIKLPKLPRRAGAVDITLVAELVNQGEVLTRVAFGVSLNVSEQAALPLIDKGARVDLVITTGSARISAAAVALDAADVGDVIQFKVMTTSRVLRGKLETRTSATVVAP